MEERVEGIPGDVFTEQGAPPIDTPIGGPQMTYPDLTSTGMRIPPTVEQDPYGTQFTPLTEGELAIITALTRRYRASLLVKPSGQGPRTPAHSPLSEQLTGESAHAGSEETVQPVPEHRTIEASQSPARVGGPPTEQRPIERVPEPQIQQTTMRRSSGQSHSRSAGRPSAPMRGRAAPSGPPGGDPPSSDDDEGGGHRGPPNIPPAIP